MFNNWINTREIYNWLKRSFRNPQVVYKFFFRLQFNRSEKVKAAWSNTKSPPTNWWDIPAVKERWNFLISGDRQIDFYKYISQNFFAGKASLRAMSLGCGTGWRELRWCETNKFSCIDAYDLSEVRVKYAENVARERGYGGIINYCACDVYKLEMPENSYDVVLCESSLHHFSPLETILLRLNRCLKPGGYLVLNDFVGPTKFQWTSRQLEIVNALLASFPPKYKTLWNSNDVKPSLYRPSLLRMKLSDPSEAVESSNILPLLNKIFDVVEIKGYGGTILHTLLSDISHHFLSPDVYGKRLLDICFQVEDLFLATGDIQHDFVVAVCKKRM